MDFKIGDRVRVCFPEDMRPLRWDSVQALMDGRTGTIVHCVSGFWVVRFDQPLEIIPFSLAEKRYGRERPAYTPLTVEQEPLPAMWLRKMGSVDGLRRGMGDGHGMAGHFADRTPIRPPAPYIPMPTQS
jgi:hypothetical protein